MAAFLAKAPLENRPRHRRTLIAAAIAEAARDGVRIAVAVIDFGGRMIAFARMDGVSYVIAQTAAPKAVAAAAVGAPTHALVAGMAHGPAMAANFTLAAARNPEMLVVPGGLPLMVQWAVRQWPGSERRAWRRGPIDWYGDPRGSSLVIPFAKGSWALTHPRVLPRS